MPGTNLEAVKGLVFNVKGQAAAALPSHMRDTNDVTAFLTAAYSAVSKNQQLQDAVANAPQTLVTALMDAAQKGLTPGTEQYYLTPRKVKGRWEVLGIVGYQGYIEMMHRAGYVASVHLAVVREKDSFDYVRGEHSKPVHRVNWFGGDRGKIIGAYAYADMRDGGVSQVVIIDDDRIKRAKESSSSARSEYSPWARNEEAMWLKTAARDLAKWVPTSAEIRVLSPDAPATVDDLASAPNDALDVDPETGEVITND